MKYLAVSHMPVQGHFKLPLSRRAGGQAFCKKCIPENMKVPNGGWWHSGKFSYRLIDIIQLLVI